MHKLASLLLIALLVAPAVLGAVYVKPEDIRFREGGVQRFNEYAYDPRIQYKKTDIWVYLTPPQPPIFARGYPPFYPRGTARVTSVRSALEPVMKVDLNVKELRPSWEDNTYYQAWLYDVETGSSFNLGLFEAYGGGVASLEYWSAHYVDAYDYILVTREPRYDIDPRPSNDEVLIGKLVQRQFFEPLPLLGEREQYGYTYYGE